MTRRTAICAILIAGAGPLLSAGQASARQIKMPPPAYEQTREAVAACGVPAANVHISYEDELQTDVVMVGDMGAAEEAKLPCILEAVHPFYWVQFEDDATNAAYSTLVWEEGRRRATLQGRQWLDERGLLQGMPIYKAGKVPLTQFVRQVENHCSVRTGSAIEILASSHVSLRDQFMQSISNWGSRRGGDRLTCLMNVLAASNLAQGGVSFGFVGSEANSNEAGKR